MICDAPTQALAPPAWTMTVAGKADPQTVLGFVTAGNDEQLTVLAAVVQKLGMNCEVPASEETPKKMLVLFGPSTTRDVALGTYERIVAGEFGTSAGGLLMVPASEAQRR